MERNKDKTKIKLIILGIVLLVLCLLSMRYGSARLSSKEFLSGLSDTRKLTPFGVIIYSIRLPRTLGAVISGASLAISGTILQSITNNKMASPGLVGVSSGAGFAVILSLTLFPMLSRFIPVFSFAGAFLATLFIVTLSKKLGFSRSTVVLAGLALSALLSSGISFMSLLDSDVLVSYNAFSIGSLSGIKPEQLVFPFIMTVLSFITSLIKSSEIDILSLGDDVAASLGIKTASVRTMCMLVSSVSAASAVSFAGLVGFVGLMAGHIAKKLLCRADMRAVLPASALTGAILVTASDLIGRALFAPSEIPVGIILSLIGSPFFIVLLLCSGGESDA